MQAFSKSKKSKKKINWWRKTVLLGSIANKKYIAINTAAIEPQDDAMATTLWTKASWLVNLTSWLITGSIRVSFNLLASLDSTDSVTMLPITVAVVVADRILHDSGYDVVGILIVVEGESVDDAHGASNDDVYDEVDSSISVVVAVDEAMLYIDDRVVCSSPVPIRLWLSSDILDDQ